MGTLLGTILAWLVERTNMPFRRLLFGAALVPLIMPGSLATFAWVLILSPTVGVVNVALQNMFGFESGPLSVTNMPGMIFVEGIHLSTLSFLLICGALRSMDASLEEAAVSSGASTLETARRVTLPLLLPAIASTLLIGFVRAIESFEVPAMLGLPGREYVLSSQIYLALKTFPVDYSVAGTYSTLLFLIGAAGVLIYLRMLSKGGFETVTGKGYRPRQIDLRGWRLFAFGFGLLYVLVLFVLPALLMIWASFLPYYSPPSLDATRLHVPRQLRRGGAEPDDHQRRPQQLDPGGQFGLPDRRDRRDQCVDHGAHPNPGPSSSSTSWPSCRSPSPAWSSVLRWSSCTPPRRCRSTARWWSW